MAYKKHAIITGAASGLGRALSILLARHGWHVAVADIDDSGAQETLNLILSAGGNGQVEHLDVTSPHEWRALGERLESTWPALDLLVNNAGVGVGGEVGKISLDDWQWIIDINLYGVIYGCHTMIEWLKSNPQGAHIVNVASMAGIVSPPGMAPYNVTKAGVIALSETLYGELKAHNVGVTAVCPSFFQTNIVKNSRFDSQAQHEFAVKMMNESKATAEQVALRIYEAVQRKQLYVVTPRIAKFFWLLKRLAPRWTINMIAKRGTGERSTKSKSAAEEYAKSR